MAAERSLNRPPSEKLSGVTLTIPMMRGMAGTGYSSSMAQLCRKKKNARTRCLPDAGDSLQRFLRSVLAGRVAESVITLRPGLAGLGSHLGAGAARAAGVGPAGWRARLAAGHDVVDLLGIDGLVLDQGLGHQVQLVGILPQDLRRALEVAIDDGAHSLVDVPLRQ